MCWIGFEHYKPQIFHILPCCFATSLLSSSFLYEMPCMFCFHSAEAIDPLLDVGPVDMYKLLHGALQERISALKPLMSLAKTGKV